MKVGAIIAATAWIFSPAFSGDWLWDDFEISQNQDLHQWSGLLRMWYAPAAPDYAPVKTTFLWIAWHLFGDNLFAYHVLTASLHALGALLLWRVLRKLGVRLAWLAGLLFAVHPVAVESVAWAGELKNTLSFPLLLLSFSAYLAWDSERWSVTSLARSFDSATEWRSIGQLIPVTSLLWYVAAVLCKSSVIMFPAVILLHVWWKRGRIARPDLLIAAPFLFVSAAMGAVTVWFQLNRAIAYWNLPVQGPAARIAQAGLAIAFYFWKCVFPRNLMPIYPRWSLDPPSALQFLPWLVVAAVFLGLWKWGRGRAAPRHLIFGLGWFLLFLVPVLGFVPMAYQHVAPVADHLCYLSLAGLVGLAAAGAGMGQGNSEVEQEGREEREGRTTRLFGLLVLPVLPVQILSILLVAGLAVESRRYAGVFVDQETMWTYNQARNPHSAAVFVNLGFIQHHDQKLDESIRSYEEAIRLEPRDAQAEDELASVYADRHEPEKAISHYRRVLQLQPKLAKTRASLAKALADAGRPREAAAEYERLIRDDPRDAAAEANFGKLLDDQGSHFEAKTHLEKALALDPASHGAENDLGMALVGLGKPLEGVKHIEEALRMKPDFPEAENNLGFALAGMGRQAEAIPHLEEALRLKPAFAQAENNLGYALAATGRRPEAITHLEKALKLSPDDAKAHYNLAMLLEAAGRDREALRHLESALALKPDFEPAKVALRHLRVLLIASGQKPET